ncbi:MAG: L-rhamnose mutarotase [Paludibacter sp.]
MEKINHQNVKRYCQTLDLKDNDQLIEEYKYWHKAENIWPEIPKGIREVGILDMEIYILGNRLFMIIETYVDFNWDASFAELAGKERQKEWETFVSKFQISAENASSSDKWQLMERIFKL